MNVEEFAVRFVEKFPEYKAKLDEHKDDYGEVLGHVFFGNIINKQLHDLLKYNGDDLRIKKLFDFINEFYIKGNDACKNIVIVTTLEYLGNDREVLNKSYNYLIDEIIKESIKNELSWGMEDYLLSDKSMTLLHKYFALYGE